MVAVLRCYAERTVTSVGLTSAAFRLFFPFPKGNGDPDLAFSMPCRDPTKPSEWAVRLVGALGTEGAEGLEAHQDACV